MNERDVRDIFNWSYNEYLNNCADASKYEWAASYVFDLTTYDGELDEIFVKKIIEVCEVILDKTNFKYILDDSNYKTFILVCQLLDRFHWIEWGTSIRGAWFQSDLKSRPILDSNLVSHLTDDNEWVDEGHCEVPFTEKNLKLLIKFLEENNNEQN